MSVISDVRILRDVRRVRAHPCVCRDKRLGDGCEYSQQSIVVGVEQKTRRSRYSMISLTISQSDEQHARTITRICRETKRSVTAGKSEESSGTPRLWETPQHLRLSRRKPHSDSRLVLQLRPADNGLCTGQRKGHRSESKSTMKMSEKAERMHLNSIERGNYKQLDPERPKPDATQPRRILRPTKGG